MSFINVSKRMGLAEQKTLRESIWGTGGGGGGKEGEKYLLSYKRQLVTLVLYLLKCDGQCKKEKKKKKHVKKS